MRKLFVTFCLFPFAVNAEFCGIPDHYLQALSTVMYAVDERAEELGTAATDSGSVAVRWSMSDTCIKAAQSSDVFAYENVLEECFVLLAIESTGERALNAAEILEDELPNSIVVVGWAVSDSVGEFGMTKMYSRLSIPNYPVLILDQTGGLKIECLEDVEVENSVPVLKSRAGVSLLL